MGLPCGTLVEEHRFKLVNVALLSGIDILPDAGLKHVAEFASRLSNEDHGCSQHFGLSIVTDHGDCASQHDVEVVKPLGVADGKCASRQSDFSDVDARAEMVDDRAFDLWKI